jgi:hypothetical protein
LSLLPPLGAAVGLALYHLVVPRLNRIPERFAIPCFLMLMAAGQTLLMLMPAGQMSLVLLACGLASAGSYLGSVAINTALNNRMGALHKADAYSAVQLLVALATIPAGWLAGSLFEASPRLSLAGIIGVLGLATLMHVLQSTGRPLGDPATAASARPDRGLRAHAGIDGQGGIDAGSRLGRPLPGTNKEGMS